GDRYLSRGPLRRGDERTRRRRVGFADHQRYAAVAAFTNRLIDRQTSEERHAELLGQPLAAATAEDIGFVFAVRAREVAHVLDQPDRRNVQLLVHRHGTTRVGQRHQLRRRDDDRSGDRYSLTEAEGDVAGARRHVDDQIV